MLSATFLGVLFVPICFVWLLSLLRASRHPSNRPLRPGVNEMRKPAFGVSALLIALTLGACSMAPTYERPAAPVADSWSGAAAQRQGAAIDTLDWKSFIVDAELRRLVDVALDNNRSLRQTLLDIEAARAQYRIQRADRVPGLNAAATGNRQRQPADLSAGNRSEVASSYQVGLALPEYELDLFGRVKSLTDAACNSTWPARRRVRHGSPWSPRSARPT